MGTLSESCIELMAKVAAGRTVKMETGLSNEGIRKALDQEEWIQVERDREERTIYIGTVFNLTPSGKYYMPWACSNVTEAEADKDVEWYDAVQEQLEEIDCYLQHGEGDPCDLLVGECRDIEERYAVLWDNGHASGTLSGRYRTREAAETAGQNWHADMVSIDHNPEEAAEEYSWEVIEEEDSNG